MSVIIMILLIGLLILVHELGHLLTALLFKVKVDKFGIGLPIGPTLWEKKVGNITLIVHAFLFGGYVSFPDDDKESDLPQNSPERLMNKPAWQRAIIFSAGVMANVICAYVLVLLTALLWGHLPSGHFDTYVKDIVAEKDASVWQSGMQKGDKIIEINGSPVDRKYTLNLYAMYSASFDGKVTKVSVIIDEGQNRQVRRMFEAIGREIKLLKRVRIGGVKLGGLKRGEFKDLRAEELSSLMEER